MGKKKRYIQRATKFGKKAFHFLDKLDGTQDSKLLSDKLDTFISEIKIVDLGNETFSLQFEGMGPGANPQAAGLEKDRVKYSIDGTAVNSNGIHTFGAGSASKDDRDNYKTTLASPARAGSGASDEVLSVGTHTISAEIIGEPAVAASVEIEFTGNPVVNQSITLISHDGTSKTYSGKTSSNAAAGTFKCNAGGELSATGLEDAITNAAQHDDKFTVVRDGAKLTITNATVGAAGNRDIVSTLDNVTISNGGKIAGGFDADDASKSKQAVKEFVISAAHVDLSSITAAEGAGGDDGKIVIKCAANNSIDVATARGSLSGETSFSIGNGAGDHAISLRVKDSKGNYVPLDADADNILTTQTNAQLFGTGTVLQKGDGVGGSTTFPAGKYTIEASPCKKDGTVISANKQVVASVEIT